MSFMAHKGSEDEEGKGKVGKSRRSNILVAWEEESGAIVSEQCILSCLVFEL